MNSIKDEEVTNMGQTMVEKILSNKIGRTVYSGDEELFTPDWICAYDFPGYIDVYRKQMAELGVKKVKHPEKFILYIDHFYPAGGPAEQGVHKITRLFAQEQGIKLIEGKGIGHQLSLDLGYVKPGDFIVHFDGHVSSLGSVGALGIGIRNSMIEAFATEEVSLVVPKTVRIDFTGKLSRGVAARDVFITLLKILGPAGCGSCIIEYGGEGLANLNMDDRFVICNLAMFMGGISSIMEPDQRTIEYVSSKTKDAFTPVYPDEDAEYLDRITLDLSTVVPSLAVPHSPANVTTIDKVVGTKVDVGLIGSCASGRLTDFAQVCEVLKGKQIAEGFRLTMVPATTEIQMELVKNGMMQILIDAGARIHFPSCDFCFGALGQLGEGEVALSTGTLNIAGRMGSDKASIYTASPYVIAASALTGVITDPREFLK
jgi:3-isopropylmalate/(R)-2-methylmalate dehydratase large subunit